MVTPSLFLACVLMGTMGGLLPDLDSDNSTPLTVGFTIFSMLVSFALVIWLSGRLPVLELIAAWAISFVTLRFGVFKLFTDLTVHRGVMHSVPYALLFGLIGLNFCFYLMQMPARNSWFIGVFITFGALIHLILDEIYSVDLLNVRVKRSFGTAIKFFHRDNLLWFALLYVAVVVGVMIAPNHDDFWLSMTNWEAWQMLRERLVR